MWLLCGTEVKKACEVFTEFLCEGEEISAPQKVSVHGVCAGGRSLCVVSSGAGAEPSCIMVETALKNVNWVGERKHFKIICRIWLA